MLVSLIRHGTSASLKTRAIRNGSSTAISSGFGSSSKGGEEGVNGWKIAIDAEQHEEDGWKGSKYSKEVRLGSSPKHEEEEINGWKKAIDAEKHDGDGWKSSKYSREVRSRVFAPQVSPISATALREREGKTTEDTAKSEVGDDARLILKQGDELPSLQDVWDSDRVAHKTEGVPSMSAPFIKTDALSSQPDAKESTGRSASCKEAVQNPELDSTFPDRPTEETLLAKEGGIRDDPTTPAEPYTTADSSFLDQLAGEASTEESEGKFASFVPVTENLEKLRQIMMAGDSRALFVFVRRESKDLRFMQAITGLTFVELLRQLHPNDDFSPLRSDYKELGPKHYWMFSSVRRKNTEALYDRRQTYNDIIKRRMESGATLDIGEYTQLLNLARSTWDGSMALRIMKEMIANEVRPNLACYSHYFEARCWSDAYNPFENQRLRVIPYNTEMRMGDTGRKVPGNVMVHGHRVQENGIGWEITSMFSRMVNEGINADTRAYCNLILAHSREGNLGAIKSIIQRIWNVNIDALLTGKGIYDHKNLPEDSPIYPTEILLYTLAHAFGSNNDIPAAMQIVAHFSSKYQIEISQTIWTELMEWTFVLSTPRRKQRLTDGAQLGQLPQRSVETLFNVMLAPPYNSKPTMRTYDFLLRSLWRRDLNNRTLYDFIDRMREGIKFNLDACEAFDAARSRLSRMQRTPAMGDQKSLDFEQEELAKAWDVRWYTFVLARHWLDLLLSPSARWLQSAKEREMIWTRKMVPDVIKEFWRFANRKPFAYATATGRVKFERASTFREDGPPTKYWFEDWESGQTSWADTLLYGDDLAADSDDIIPDEDWETLVEELTTAQEQEQEQEEEEEEESEES